MNDSGWVPVAVHAIDHPALAGLADCPHWSGFEYSCGEASALHFSDGTHRWRSLTTTTSNDSRFFVRRRYRGERGTVTTFGGRPIRNHLLERLPYLALALQVVTAHQTRKCAGLLGRFAM